MFIKDNLDLKIGQIKIMSLLKFNKLTELK